MNDQIYDHLIIGSGIAGLSLAYRLAKSGQSVVVISKDHFDTSATYYAQGGIASVFDKDDSFDQHIRDTLEAGAGLCHKPVVKTIVENGPEVIRELLDIGVQFTKDDNSYHLNREGGHSQRRVFHSNDTTGREILTALLHTLQSMPNVEFLENILAIDLICSDHFAPQFDSNSCVGIYGFCQQSSSVKKLLSRRTYLCTGGHGKAYLYTSNPDAATGDGLAMAARAGCRVANLEFMQFHPTCLFHPSAKNFLISEAVRGEGGVLRDAQGREFVKDFDPRGSLAPRDIVARAIDFEMKRTGADHVYLDITHLAKEKIIAAFPKIYETCQSFGFDMSKEALPVVPAAHYSCGGVVTNMVGQTSLANLYAIGEVACTGLHGANRLASNSLLEASVIAKLAAEHVLKSPNSSTYQINPSKVPDWQPHKESHKKHAEEGVLLAHAWDETRRLMWNYMGIVRSDMRLLLAKSRLATLQDEVDVYYWNQHLSSDLIELRNIITVAQLSVRCAMKRKESRGIHYTTDYPERDEVLFKKDTVLS